MRPHTADSFPGIVQRDTGPTRAKGQPNSDGIAVNPNQERVLELDAEHIFLGVPRRDRHGRGDRTAVPVEPLCGKLTGEVRTVDDSTPMTSVGPRGANAILDDLAEAFGVAAGK